MHVLYNGVDVERFHPRQRRPVAPPLLLGIGRLVEKKGFGHLVDAAASLLRSGARIRCAIAGDGEDRAALAARVADAGVSGIELLGVRNHDEVRALLAEATMLVLPCVIGADGNRDALPTVLLEALAMGVPAISTPVAGVSEIFDGGRCGLLVPCGDTPALQRAIVELLESEPRRTELAQHGRGRAEQCFDLRQSVGRLAGWMQGACRTGVA